MSDPTKQYKNPVFPREATRRGEIYGTAHGYSLSTDGLVYHKEGSQPAARGWYRFYFLNRRAADAWLLEKGAIDPAPPPKARGRG